MPAAVIEMGWITNFYEGDTPGEIIRALEKVQDFGCMFAMGYQMEDENGRKELDKLRNFLSLAYNDCLTMEDISELDIHLSIGNVRCIAIAETPEEVEALKKGHW